MTSDPIETDDMPCPLTVGEWIALLAAKSQSIHGYKHLAVVVLLAAFTIVMAGFTGTDFESFGFFLRLFSVAAFCVIFVVLIFCAKRTINIFKERDEDLEIIEEIISGKLTDSDEIRERYYERKRTPDQM